MPLALMLLVVSAGADITAPFQSDAGSFEVLFPSPPEDKVQIQQFDSVRLETHVWTADLPQMGFLVSYTDSKPMQVRQQDESAALKAAQDSATRGATLVNDRALKWPTPQHDAREFTFLKGDQRVTQRVFYAGSRLYQLMVVRPAEPPRDEAAQVFLESFKLTGAAKRPAAPSQFPPARQTPGPRSGRPSSDAGVPAPLAPSKR